jgi:hypothetical protein
MVSRGGAWTLAPRSRLQLDLEIHRERGRDHASGPRAI